MKEDKYLNEKRKDKEEKIIKRKGKKSSRLTRQSS